MLLRVLIQVGLLVCLFLGIGSSQHHSDGGKKKSDRSVYGHVDRGVATYSCHDGFQAQGQGVDLVCIRRDLAPIQTTCRAGLLQDGRCLLFERPIFSCAPGYVEAGRFDHTGKDKKSERRNLCIRVERQPFDRFCPVGSSRAGPNCISFQSSPVIMICPVTSSENNGKKHHNDYTRQEECFDTIAVSPIAVCGPGLKFENGLCYGFKQQPCGHEASVVLLNDSGKKHRHMGEKHGHSDFVQVAPVPSKSKYCKVRFSAPASYICPEGSFEVSGKKDKHHAATSLLCQRTVPVALQPFCPDPNAVFDPITGTCRLEIIEIELQRCPAGLSPCNQDDIREHKKKKKDQVNYTYDQGCCVVNYAEPLPGCPVNSQLIGNQCQITTEAQLSCPHGYISEQGGCVNIVTKPPKIHYTINVTTKRPSYIQSDKKKKH